MRSTAQQGSTYGSRTRSNDNSQSQIERIHIEAQTVLTQKNQEIEQYNNAIEEAEKELAQLKAELNAKEIMFAVNEQDHSENELFEEKDEESEYDQIKALHESEVMEIKAKHEDEIQTLQINFTKALKEAELWAEQHAETLLLEKKAELEQLTQELEYLKTTQNEEAFTKTQSRTRLYQQSRTQSLQNSQRIADLNSQLSELSAISREELREVRGKIDECFVAVDIRQREHKNELEKYEREIQYREAKYNSHIATLNEQFLNEKQRLETQLAAANSKKQNLARVSKQLEKHHEMQIQTTMKDLERMKNSILQAQSREDQTLNETKTQVSQIQSVQRETKNTEQEIIIVNKEILELQDENRDLQNELRRLQSMLSGKNLTARSLR